MRVAAAIISQLPDRVRSRFDVDRHLAIVFGRVCSGRAANAIPTESELSGTARVEDTDVWRALPEIIEWASEEISAEFGAGVDAEIRRALPWSTTTPP